MLPKNPLIYFRIAVFTFAMVIFVAIWGTRDGATARPTPHEANPAFFPSLLKALGFKALATEDSPGDSSCNTGKDFTDFQAPIDPVTGVAYQHGALRFMNSMLGMENKVFPAGAEMALCHFHKSMELNPDKSALPITVSKTFGAKTVSLTVISPTESWATALGYDAKGTVSVNGDTFMVLYWGGSNDSSKGFMIEGPKGIGGGPGGKSAGKHMSFIQWDRTSADQFVKIFAGTHSSSYMGSASTGDRAMFGTATYNTSTKAFTVQMVEMEQQRISGTGFGCYRMYASGTKAGTVQVAKTSDSNTNGQSKTSTDKTVANVTSGTADASTDFMDSFQGTDSSDTVNGTGNVNNTTHNTLWSDVSFGKSCNDVYTAGSNASIFGDATTTINFAAQPTDVF